MSVFTRDIPITGDTRYARDIAFPFQFNEDCDLRMDEDNEVIEQALQLLTFIKKGSVRLHGTIGSEIKLALFDTLDEETELIIDASLRAAFEENERRIILDKEFVFDQSADESTLFVIVPYRVVITGLSTATKLIVERPISG